LANRAAISGGERTGPVERVASHRMWEIVALQDRGDELAAAVHAGPVENGFK